MKYMVFVIYVIVIMQFVNSKPVCKANSIRRGKEFYKISGIVNVASGMIGMLAVNTFLRDKNIIPQTFVWIALVGFGITMIYGIYCIYIMLVSIEW